MAEISRSALFGRLSGIAYKALESAHAYCRIRENPYVELSHWLHQILQMQGSDLAQILDGFDIPIAKIKQELNDTLETLPRGSTSVVDFSPHLESATERGFVFGSLLYNEYAVRTGHIILGLLKTSSLTNVLKAASPTLGAISADELSDRFQDVTAGSPEVGGRSKSGGEDEASGVPPAIENVPSKGSTSLDKYCNDMTEAARQGKMDRIVGRDTEIRQLIDILLRRRQNNPILTGEAGVGKTAVVEGLAGRIADGEVPPPLKGVRLLALDVGALSAGASMKGEFEKRLKQVIEDVQASTRPIIMFIDEAHTLIGAGGSQGTGDAANLLKPALARGELRTVAATTWSEYKKYIEKDPALTRRFQVVKVNEPDDENATAMMRAVSSMLEKHHKVRILDDALKASVVLSRRYIADRQLPDKSVSLLDTACARVTLSQTAIPARVEATQRRIGTLDREQDILTAEEKVGVSHKARIKDIKTLLKDEKAALKALTVRWTDEKELFETIAKLEAKLLGEETDTKDVNADDTKSQGDPKKWLKDLEKARKALEALQDEDPLILPAVDETAIAQVIADWTGVPLGRMVKDEMETVLNLAEHLKARVVGQETALKTVAKRVRTSRAGLSDPEKPVGVFMLCGPSGVGKTETALALAETLYGGEHNLITINMSEFQESHTVSTLKGAPPGYVGYGEGGKLTEAVRRKPYSVVLLDEVEKAHPDVHEVFFQVFDKGNMEDGEGRSIDFKNTLIILTSNVGSDELMRLVESSEGVPDEDAAKEVLRDPLLSVFPAALLGRMIIIPYYPLTDEVLTILIKMRLDKVVRRAKSVYDATMTYSDDVVSTILSRCQERESGGRVVDAILTNTVLPELSEAFLTSRLDGANIASISLLTKNEDFVYEFQ